MLKINKNIIFLIAISLEVVLFHGLLFSDTSFNFIVFFQAFIILGFLLSINKTITITSFILETLIFVILFTYHNYFNTPINLLNISHQYKEGLDVLLKEPNIIWHKASLLILLSAIIKIYYIKKYYTPIKVARLFIIPILIFMFLMQQTFNQQTFYISYFNKYANMFGYFYAFNYQIHSYLDNKELEEKIKNTKFEKLDLGYKISKSKNIYVIQFESLDYHAINKETTPFLESLKNKAIFYKIMPKEHRPSCNADFVVLTTSTIYNDTSYIVYPLLNENIYNSIQTLPKLLNEYDYTTGFYHGYRQDFFNRGKHINKMGFDKVFFQSDLPKTLNSSNWGVDDKDLFSFVLSEKTNFNFIITVSSHSPFEIGKKHLSPYKTPKTEKELYFNSINYVDRGLKKLISNSPEDSLFIIYSDHQSEVLEDTSTAMIVYDKQKKTSLKKSIDFKDLPYTIRTILEESAIKH
ncbi:MAG: sulfatase-like hydrolase/transferase [Alphaproteobacteria bacterium]